MQKIVFEVKWQKCLTFLCTHNQCNEENVCTVYTAQARRNSFLFMCAIRVNGYSCVVVVAAVWLVRNMNPRFVLYHILGCKCDCFECVKPPKWDVLIKSVRCLKLAHFSNQACARFVQNVEPLLFFQFFLYEQRTLSHDRVDWASHANGFLFGQRTTCRIFHCLFPSKGSDRQRWFFHQVCVWFLVDWKQMTVAFVVCKVKSIHLLKALI